MRLPQGFYRVKGSKLCAVSKIILRKRGLKGNYKRRGGKRRLVSKIILRKRGLKAFNLNEII